MLLALMIGMATFFALYAWLTLHRFRVLWLENRVEDLGLDRALAERRAEAGEAGAGDRALPVGSAVVIVASTPWVSVGICYTLVFGSVGLLAWRSRQRGRQLAEQVPPEQRTWMARAVGRAGE